MFHLHFKLICFYHPQIWIHCSYWIFFFNHCYMKKLLLTTRRNRTWRYSGGCCVDQFSRVLGSWGNSGELRTKTSDLRFRHPTTNHNNNTSLPLVIARCAVSERALHRDTVDMPPKKRSSGTPQKKELKGTMKSGSPDSNENAVLSPERWAYTAPLTLK